MAFIKNSAGSGKRQAAGSGLRSAASKKNVATTKSTVGRVAPGSGKRNGLRNSTNKASSGPAYSSLRSRQILLEKLRRQIWAAAADVNQALIAEAKKGNLPIAKALFDFAGVYSLPEPSEEAAAAPLPVREVPEPEEAQAQGPVIGEDVDPVDAFFCSIGMAPSAEEDQPAESELEVRMG